MATASETLYKTVDESRILTMDFSDDMETGETISSCSPAEVTPATGAPTFGTPSISGQQVQAMCSGGTEGKYRVAFEVTTSVSEVLEGIGWLYITDSI